MHLTAIVLAAALAALASATPTKTAPALDWKFAVGWDGTTLPASDIGSALTAAPTAPAALFTSHVAAIRAPARGRSNLRRAATMPDLEPGGCGLDGLSFFSADVPSGAAMDYTVEATLIAEPDMDEFDVAGQAPAVAAWNAPSIQASLYAGDFASPSASGDIHARSTIFRFQSRERRRKLKENLSDP